MAVLKFIGDLFGNDAPGTSITTLQATARAALMYGFAIVAVRIEKNRLLGQMSVLDMVLIYLFGSIWSRAINGSGTLSATILASLALILLHTAFLNCTFRSEKIGKVLKGQPVPLIKDGKIIDENLRRTSISHHDLYEALRLNGNLERPEEAQSAYLERNGQISVVRKQKS